MFGVFWSVLIIGVLIHPSYQTNKCPKEDGPVPVYYIDPTNCHRFYECVNGHPLLFYCPAHTVFNEHLNVCVNSRDGKCIVGVAEKLQESRLADECPLEDDGWTTFVKDPNNCHKYSICSKGNPELQECPRGLEFNARLLVCDYPHRSGCQVKSSRVSGNSHRLQTYLADDLEIAAIGRSHKLESYTNNDLEEASIGSQMYTDNNLEVASTDGPSLAKKCPREDGDWPTYLIDPKDCSKFFECSHGRPIPMQCPHELYFSTDSLTCDVLENVDCDGRKHFFE